MSQEIEVHRLTNICIEFMWQNVFINRSIIYWTSRREVSTKNVANKHWIHRLDNRKKVQTDTRYIFPLLICLLFPGRGFFPSFAIAYTYLILLSIKWTCEHTKKKKNRRKKNVCLSKDLIWILLTEKKEISSSVPSPLKWWNIGHRTIMLMPIDAYW